MMNRRKEMIYAVQMGMLPPEYQRQKVLKTTQNSGTHGAFLNVGRLTTNCKIEVDFELYSIPSVSAISGVTGSNDGTELPDNTGRFGFGREPGTAGGNIYIGIADKNINSGVPITVEKHRIILESNGHWQIDNTTGYTQVANFVSNIPFLIFMRNGTNYDEIIKGVGINMGVMRFKMWNEGAAYRDLIPCYRKVDAVLGMYDLINGSFYSNQGDRPFESED